VEHYGVDHVRVLDLNCDTIGTSKHGVLIRDGSEPFDEHIDWCDLGLVTGSTIVNNTIDEIANRFNKRQTPLTFFGNTISGTAYLLSLPHLCPYGE
jgi:hypothetical protein